MKNKINENFLLENYIKKTSQQIKTIIDFLRWTISKFNKNEIFYGHGTDNAVDEAISLIFNSLSLPVNIPDVMLNAKLTLSERLYLIRLVIKRVKKRIPVSYLISKSWFCGLEFYVNENVFIPRSPIGELIENKFKGLLTENPKNILDMCTGSGCIAIACSYIYPKAKIDAVDISQKALTVAKHNVNLHNLKKQIKLIKSDLFCNLPIKKYDMIISNPPYVSNKEISKLPLEFKKEPVIAFRAGDNCLKFIKLILINSLNYLSDTGVLICELGENTKKLVKLYPDVPFTWLKFNKGGKGVFIINKSKLLNSLLKKKIINLKNRD